VMSSWGAREALRGTVRLIAVPMTWRSSNSLQAA